MASRRSQRNLLDGDANRSLIEIVHKSLMVETLDDVADRAAPSATRQRQTSPDRRDDPAGGGTSPPTGHRRAESALAYDLLLPDSVTAIASIRVAGDPVLAPPRRDGVTMVSCRLTGDEAPFRGSAEMTSDGRALPFAPSSLDCVILHGTLDRWRDARGLLIAVRSALRPGGIVALSVANGLSPIHWPPHPRRRSLWGYHRLLRRCGLSPSASYFVLGDASGAPSRIISTRYAPSTAFFRLQSADLTGAKRLLMLGLNAVNLLPHAQDRFLILARK
jgi:SAM-dependent methyltransferase